MILKLVSADVIEENSSFNFNFMPRMNIDVTQIYKNIIYLLFYHNNILYLILIVNYLFIQD